MMLKEYVIENTKLYYMNSDYNVLNLSVVERIHARLLYENGSFGFDRVKPKIINTGIHSFLLDVQH